MNPGASSARRLPALRSDPDEHLARRGKMMNLCAPDIAGLFASRCTPAQLIALRKISPPKDRICSWWCERYDDSALSTELALVAGSAA